VEERELDDSVVSEGREEEDEESSQFEPGPLAPCLTVRAALSDSLDDERDHPDDSCTDSLKDSAVDGREGVSDEHSVAVVRKDGDAEEGDSANERLVGAEADERVDCVLEAVVGHRGVVESRDEICDGARDEDHSECAPDALKSDNAHRGHVEVAKEELLNDDLAGLDDLGADDEGDADEHFGCVCRLVRLGDQQASQADHAKGDEAEDDAEDLVGEDAAAGEEDAGEDGGEDDHGATEHLEDGHRDVDEAVCHHG